MSLHDYEILISEWGIAIYLHKASEISREKLKGVCESFNLNFERCYENTIKIRNISIEDAKKYILHSYKFNNMSIYEIDVCKTLYLLKQS